MTGRLSWAEALRLARRGTPNDHLRTWASALSAGVAAALVCLGVSLTTMGWGPVESIVWVVADGGTRGGVAFAVGLVAIAVLSLTASTWRLGSVERRDRLVQLRDAGATPRDLRRVAVAETTVPVVVGAVVGVAVLGTVFAVLDSWPRYGSVGYVDDPLGGVQPSPESMLVGTYPIAPNPLLETPWAPVVGVVLVVAAAALLASRASRSAVHPRERRGWSVVAALAGGLASRVGLPALVLALRRIAADPRTTSGPAALLFLAALVASSSAWLELVARANTGEQRWAIDTYQSQAYGLVRWATVVGLVLCALGLAVSLGDAVVRRRRADAAARAAGVPVTVLRAAIVLQAMLPAVPAVAGGMLLGAGVAVSFTGTSVDPVSERATAAGIPLPWVAWVLWSVAILTVAALAALLASTLLSRTTRLDQLRVPA